MKNKKITKVLLSIIIACILISPNNVEAKKACNSFTTKNACAKRGDCSWNKTSKKCSNKSCSKITKKSDCDGSRCNWKNNQCVKKSSGTSGTTGNTSTTTTLSKLEFCAKTAVIWQIVGWVILIVKIVIPMLLIILGVVDFSKAAISGKDDETKKSLTTLMWRAVSAVVIFFIPTLVTLVMGLVANFKDSGAQADFEVCRTCILDPKNCDTSKDAGKN